MSKRVLLTGGLGFIGSHTVEHWLKNTDWDIVVMDALRFSGRVERLTDIDCFDPDRVRVVWHDLRAPIHSQLVDSIGVVDWIVNMASDSHVDRSITDPVPFVENNVALVLNMLEYARKVKPDKFIQISTDEVYGPAPVGHSHREGEVLRPSNPYSASKAAQEMIAFSYWRTFDVPVIITNCWDMETKLWTTTGLKSFDDVSIGDKVWTLDANENLVQEPVLDKVRMSGPKEMVHISGVAEQMVTPNHRMMFRRLRGKVRSHGRIEEVLAGTLLNMPNRIAIPRNGNWEGNDSPVMDTPLGEKSTDWVCRLFGWHITEGHVSGTTVAIGAAHEPQKQTVKDLLNGLGNVYENERSIRVANKTLANYLNVSGHLARGKRIPDFIKDLSPKYLQVFIETAIEGDGTFYGNGGVIYTISEELANDYAEVAIKAGYAVAIKTRTTKHPRKETRSESYIVRLSDKRNTRIEKQNVSIKSNNDDVWCVRVPSGRVFTQRNGGITLTGQTMNNFGERQHPEKYVPMVMSRILNGEPIQVHAKDGPDGWTIGARVWLHARNHGDAVQFILENAPVIPYSDDDPEPERFNIAGEKEINNLEIAEMVGEILGIEPITELVDFHSSRPGHDLRYSLDGTKLREAGWQQPMTIEESFEQTVQWTHNHPEWLIL